ncbi:hypothetical protein QPL51_03645 [Escherichia coli]|uniref:hypothetical protein n=1 Tax=Escherichia coli TaxID=562 RepID=UPI00287B3529|nr:hypothetical protein [Escherichia coli]MDS1552131.1 hypothetical protein [Escherichia coli]
MKKKLNEQGLRPQVLKDLIHPIISVDEYTPKIEDSNIVIMFQVLNNFDAAYDLSSFIEKSPIHVVDTEAAETPNLDGRYQVYVEMERNAEFPEKLLRLIKTIENICPDPGWKIQLYGVNDPIDVDFEEIQQRIDLGIPSSISEFLDYAGVSVIKEGNMLTLKTAYGKLHYSTGSGFVSETYVKKLLKNDTQLDTSRLSSILGESYTVLRSGDQYVIGRNGKYLVLR